MHAETSPSPASPTINEGSRVGDVLSGAACGVVGAMAMTGMRVLTTELGLVEQTPPQALGRQRAGVRALLRRAPRKQRRGLTEAAHWAFGAGGGAAFGGLPREVKGPFLDRTAVRAGGVVGVRAGDRARSGPQPGQACAPDRSPGAGRRPPAVRPGAIGDTPGRATLDHQTRPRRETCVR